MSYNISTWTTKKLENFTIPLMVLYDKSIREDWRPDDPTLKLEGDEIGIVIDCGEDSYIEGIYDAVAKTIKVSDIRVHYEGSGTFFYDVLLPALEKSSGRLEAVLVWERGDSISRLKVLDGVVTREQVEL